MSFNSTSRAESLWRALVASLLLTLVAGPLLALVVQGADRFSLGLLVHLAGTVLPMQLGYSVAAAAGAVLFGALLAAGGLGCALFEFPGRRLLHRLLLIPILLPAWFLAVVYHEAAGADGIAGLSLVMSVSAAPLFHLFGTAALRNLPGRYLEVLRLLGRGEPSQIVRIVAPLAIPALSAAAVLVGLSAWSDGGSAQTMAVPTLTVGLLDQWFGREDSAVGALLGLVFAGVSLAFGLLLWSVVKRAVWQDRARLGSGPFPRTRLRGATALAPWLLSVPQLAAGLAIPSAIVGLWASQRFNRVSLVTLWSDGYRTLLLGGGAAVFAAVVAWPILAIHASSSAPRVSSLLTRMSFALFALPPSVLALSVFLLLPDRRGSDVMNAFNGSAFPMVMALGLRFSAVFVAASQSALLRQARDHVAQMRVLGHTGMGAFAALLRPFLARPLTAAAAFVFLEAIKDQLLPLVLRPFGYETLATRVFQYAQTQRPRDCAVWILCLALIGIYPLFTLANAGDSEADNELAGDMENRC